MKRRIRRHVPYVVANRANLKAHADQLFGNEGVTADKLKQLITLCSSNTNKIKHTLSVFERLEQIDKLLHNYGIERIDETGYKRLYYSNTGDTYAITIMFHVGTARFLIGSWGAWVEYYTL